MSGSSIKAGQAYVEIGIRNRIAKGAKDVQRDLDALAKKTSSIGLKMMTASAGILAPITAATFGFASAGDEIHKMSIRTGISAESLSQLGFAAEQSGSDLGSIEKGIRGMQRSLYDAGQGSSMAVDALDAIGLSVDMLEGMQPEDQFTALADSIAGIDDPSQRAAVAMKLFGRAGSDLIPLFAESAKGIANLRKEADDLGRTMTTEDAAAAAEFTDAMNRLKSVMLAVKNQIGAAVAPVFTEFSQVLLDSVSGASEFLRENRDMIVGVTAAAVAVGAAGTAFVALGGGLTLAGVAVGGIGTALSLLATPFGAATLAAAGLGTAIWKYTTLGGDAVDWLSNRFGPLVETVQTAVAAITTAVGSGDIDQAWSLTADLMELTWLDLTSEIRNAWEETMGWVLDSGSSVAEGLGAIFEALANTLDGLLDSYKSYYDKVYNATEAGLSAAGNYAMGVETIGGPAEPKGSAFDKQFGAQRDALREAIDGVRQFGQNMQEEASGQVADRMAEREAAKAERAKRLADLRDSVNDTAAEVIKNAPLPVPKPEPKPDPDSKPKPSSHEGSEQTSGAGNSKSGDTGTFSSAAAMIIGQGPSTSQRMLSLTERIAKAVEAKADRQQGKADREADRGSRLTDSQKGLSAMMESMQAAMGQTPEQLDWSNPQEAMAKIAAMQAGLAEAMATTRDGGDGGVKNKQATATDKTMTERTQKTLDSIDARLGVSNKFLRKQHVARFA